MTHNAYKKNSIQYQPVKERWGFYVSGTGIPGIQFVRGGFQRVPAFIHFLNMRIDKHYSSIYYIYFLYPDIVLIY